MNLMEAAMRRKDDTEAVAPNGRDCTEKNETKRPSFGPLTEGTFYQSVRISGTALRWKSYLSILATKVCHWVMGFSHKRRGGLSPPLVCADGKSSPARGGCQGPGP